MNENVFSVTQVNAIMGELVKGNPVLSRLCVKGEITNYKGINARGHVYFSLKDANAQISCVIFAGTNTGISHLREGQNVLAYGRINVYEKGGYYQLIVSDVIDAGIGLLYEQLEALKEKLRLEGLFSPEHKKPIPKYVKTVGVVTSETGAVIHDIETVSRRRNRFIRLFLYPCMVQGKGAAATIIKGIKYFDGKVDVIIFGRGGGSFEDLFEYNDEELVRTVYNCKTPIISAIGHEVDTTLADMASDKRAATPSEAAELAVFEYDKFVRELEDRKSKLSALMHEKIDEYRDHVSEDVKRDISKRMHHIIEKNRYRLTSDKKKQLSILIHARLNKEKDTVENRKQALQNKNPRYVLDMQKIRLDHIADGLASAMKVKLTGSKQRMKLLMERLEGVSPIKRLSKGYSFVSDENGRAVKKLEDVRINDKVKIELQNGTITARVEELTERKGL